MTDKLQICAKGTAPRLVTVTAAGIPGLTIDPDCCCCSIFAIVITNSNSAIDDNFKVLLNGTDIGHIDNSINAYTGRIFSEDTAFTPALLLSPQPNSFETTLLLNTALLVVGGNTLRIESIQNNGNDNFGNILVAYWDFFGTFYLATAVKITSNYFFPSGVGNGNDYVFNWP